MKKIFFIISLALLGLFFYFNYTYAANTYVNGRIIFFEPGTKVEAQYGTSDGAVRTANITNDYANFYASNPLYPGKVGEKITFCVDPNSAANNPDYWNQTISSCGIKSITYWDDSASIGEGVKNTDYQSKAYFSTTFNKYIPRNESALNTWLQSAFNWAQIILGSIAVVVISVGGILYMVSGGDPGRIKTAKMLIFNALAGVALIILARFFIVNVVGVNAPNGFF
ncbi:MAG: pilin [Patescibacteria group bacterium]|nr:pilin [Patescibacteria group bacterium]MCL5093714.1 pilin [Patescibacteria group bacterium]